MGTTTLAGILVLDSIVYEAEGGDDEGVKIHNEKTYTVSDTIGSASSVRRSSLLLKSSRKLVHKVS